MLWKKALAWAQDMTKPTQSYNQNTVVVLSRPDTQNTTIVITFILPVHPYVLYPAKET